MKTVCKKLFSLMLVALLLVSAVPFQAFADETPCTHNWVKTGVIVKEATCTEKGIAEVKCSLCEAVDGVYTDMLAHETEVKETKAPTCDATGTKTTVCKVCKTTLKEEDIPVLGHVWADDADAADNAAATCINPGIKVQECTRTGCEATQKVEIPALGHKWSAFAQTKAPTCVATGVETRTCSVCNETEDKDIAATGVHTYDNGACSVCGAKEDANDTASEFALTFHYLNAKGNWTTSLVTVKNGGTIALPSIPLVSGKDHIGWNTLKNGTGDAITAGTKWYNGMSRDIYAIYEEDSTEDGLVDLTVYAHYYVDGVYHHKERLYVKSFEKTNKNTMFTWLYSNDGMQATEAALAAEGYQWASKVYYDYFDDGAVTEADLKSDGNKAVYVKVTSKKAIEATVLLHIHTKKEHAIARTVSMSGFTAGDYVSYDDALAAVKKYYTGSKLSMSDLYDEGDWDDLMAGLGSSGSRSVKVENNGTTEIHVILSNASAKGNSNADTTNPKTGDYIMIAAGTMAMAAAALVTLAELKKRKMI